MSEENNNPTNQPPAGKVLDEIIAIEMPGIGNEIRVALLAVTLLEERITKDVGKQWPKEGTPLQAYIDDVYAAVVYLLRALPRPNYAVPILVAMLQVAEGVMVDFAKAINVLPGAEQPEPEPSKSSIPLDDSLKAV